MTQPAVSDAGQEMYDAIKQWHPSDANYGWPGLYWCEAIAGTGGLQEVYTLSQDREDGTPGWASLVDLDLCADENLPFLAQFVGVTVPQGSSRTTALNLIQTQPAVRRGTPVSIVSAVQATLIGSKHCVLLERDTSPYHATITVFASEMPNQAATLAAIAATKPGMLIIALSVTTGPTYNDIETALPSNNYGARKTMFPTYGDVQAYP